ncbi:MAG: hypothetical protein ACD_36C00036G0002 [uncultured bacterium]|uniref:Putative gluconeogenesis factor n=1 Tax=Candidatus Gottesmanbacteria bacterium RIFCSPLOWO2_01_FULL_43_11b TaxID=1798392 RepID=A0A1F6AG86_9BACT|nr:MAG: hypothetical protein ACD_36C00036G0002 [uncultured bacterium]OGG23616.1 MAG: hypothetical protein A3A79_00135 [Candidatus Gottesmanbacteria bacterium RIFCSPLOWO2_01_FULL_43_11b]
METNRKKIVCIGGGTGTFVVLRGLKHHPVSLTAIVTMSDSGGSNKRIRDEFGLLPTSDIRQCFVALSDENGGVGLLRKLFMHRFEKGKGISGMTFGNLFMAALSDILGSQKEAIKQTGKVLRIRGTVIPVTYTQTNLRAQYEDGHTVSEEHFIDEPIHDGRLKIVSVELKPKAQANPDAIRAIEQADLIVLGPGDLYTSLIPNLLISGISGAIKRSKAKKVYIVNLMTKYGQTYNFTARDHVNALSEYIGSSTLDYVLINNKKLPKTALDLYKKSHEFPVEDNLNNDNSHKVIRADLASQALITRAATDRLIRSLIRHDSTKLGGVLIKL